MRLSRNLLEAGSVPLLDDLAIDFKRRAEASTVMLSDDLVKHPVDEELESDSLDNLFKNDKVVALAHGCDVFLLDRGSFGQLICKDIFDPKQILASRTTLACIIALKSELALAQLIDYELYCFGIQHALRVSGSLTAILAWHCATKKYKD